MNASPAAAILAGERPTRRAVTWLGATAISLCFCFSFGNVWDLARHFGVPAWIAPLVGPLVDLSAVGLVIGLRYLSLAGVPGRELRPARAMLAGCGLATWALNTAEALWLRHDLGAAAFDSLAPALLIGWAEVFPWFLRKFTELATHATTATTRATTDQPTDQPDDQGPAGPGDRAATSPHDQPAHDQAASPPATTPAASGRASSTRPAATSPARQAASGATYQQVRDRYQHGQRVAAEIARELGISASYAQRTLRKVKADLARQATSTPDGRTSPTSDPARRATTPHEGDQAARSGDQPDRSHDQATDVGATSDQATTSPHERDGQPPGRTLVALTRGEGGGRS